MSVQIARRLSPGSARKTCLSNYMIILLQMIKTRCLIIFNANKLSMYKKYLFKSIETGFFSNL